MPVGSRAAPEEQPRAVRGVRALDAHRALAPPGAPQGEPGATAGCVQSEYEVIAEFMQGACGDTVCLSHSISLVQDELRVQPIKPASHAGPRRRANTRDDGP
jgi:hypothetical protein